MKQVKRIQNICLLVIAFTGMLLPLSSCKSKAESGQVNNVSDPLSVPALYERKGELAATAEWQKTKEKVAELNQKIAKQPGDVKSRLQIAAIYISEARITGEQSYYYPAIHKLLDGILSLDSKNFEAWVYKASVKMSQHQFAEAKALAEKAKAINADNAYLYGVLVDANVELGQYQEAIAMSDKMQSMKPSLESYSRASYLREIFGDYPGAIKAMAMAVTAGVTGSESCEWARVALGDLYLVTGQLDSAEVCYNNSLEVRPGFPGAAIGLAKVEKAKKNYAGAITYTENAIRTVSEVSYVSLLGDLYLLKGDTKKSTEIYGDVLRLLEKGEQEQQTVTNDAKHNGNREMAYAYLHADQLDKALVFAQNDLRLRPENIDANELVARIAYLKGDFTLARPASQKMLQTHTMNPNYLYLAGLVYKKTGDEAQGQELISKALSVNKNIDAKLIMAGQ